MSAVSNDTEESPDTMGRILPNGKLQQCRASSTETNRAASVWCRVRVKWWCKRPPVPLVTVAAGNALSGAMPNREAMVRPHRFRVGS